MVKNDTGSEYRKELIMAEEKTNKQLIQETHQGLFGVIGSEDGGLVEKVNKLVEYMEHQNGRVRRCEVRISKIWGVLLGAGLLGDFFRRLLGGISLLDYLCLLLVLVTLLLFVHRRGGNDKRQAEQPCQQICK